jgi:hypothetical protein
MVNINSVSDSAIARSSDCNYNKGLSPLIQLAEALRGFQEEKTLSFDLKVLQNPLAIDQMGGQGALLKWVLQTIEAYFGSMEAIELLIEVPSLWYRELATALIPHEVYVLYRPDEFDSYLSNPTPLSIGVHQLQQHDIRQLETPDRPIQFWVINTTNEYMNIRSRQPRYIQTDNLRLFDWFRRYEWKVPITKIDYQSHASDGEFVELFDAIQTEEPRMVVVENLPHENALLVVSITDSQGNVLHWRGENLMGLEGTYYFFTHELPIENHDAQVKIFIWRNH